MPKSTPDPSPTALCATFGAFGPFFVLSPESPPNFSSWQRSCIIQSIEFHGRLGLPLRGHRDSGELTLLEAASDSTVSTGGSVANSINYAQGNLRKFFATPLHYSIYRVPWMP